MRRFAILLVIVGNIAHADPQAADRTADEANALAKQNQFAAAALKFREAFRADPRPELMCNVGVAYYKAKDLPRAQRYLEQCVQIGASVDAGFIGAVKQVLTSLDASLHGGAFTPVSFLIEPSQASITAVGNQPFDEPILGSRVVWFPRGTFTVVIHAEGYIDQTLAIDAEANDPITRSITLVRAPAVVAPGLPAPPPTPNPRATPSRAKPIVATALAGVTAGAALACYGIARIHASDANRATKLGDYDDNVHAAHTWQNVAIGSAVLAGVSALAATYLWTRHVDLEPTARGATVSLRGTF